MHLLLFVFHALLWGLLFFLLVRFLLPLALKLAGALFVLFLGAILLTALIVYSRRIGRRIKFFLSPNKDIGQLKPLSKGQSRSFQKDAVDVEFKRVD